MKIKGRILIFFGVIIGLLLIAYGWLGLQKRPTLHDKNNNRKADVVSFIITSKPVTRGQTIAQSDLSSTLISGAAPPKALHSASDVVGRIAVTDIQAGQFVLGDLISTDPAAAGLALRVPPGRRAVSLITNEEIAVAGFVRPGDHVDIQSVLKDDVIARRNAHDPGDVSEARTLLHDIEVLAVDDSQSNAPVSKDKSAQAPATAAQRRQPTVTLAMTPDELAKFTLARSLGPYFLALRNPKDNGASFAENRARLSDIRGAASPSSGLLRRAASRHAPATARRPIDLIIGGQAQVIYPGAGQ
jgi:pilus assembly protein CpaB